MKYYDCNKINNMLLQINSSNANKIKNKFKLDKQFLMNQKILYQFRTLNSGGIIMTDKTLVCRDCGSEFVFSVGEQEFYKEKGFTNEPTRCVSCRRAKKEQNRR